MNQSGTSATTTVAGLAHHAGNRALSIWQRKPNYFAVLNFSVNPEAERPKVASAVWSILSD